jgi:hypothetical protein
MLGKVHHLGRHCQLLLSQKLAFGSYLALDRAICPLFLNRVLGWGWIMLLEVRHLKIVGDTLRIIIERGAITRFHPRQLTLGRHIGLSKFTNFRA